MWMTAKSVLLQTSLEDFPLEGEQAPVSLCYTDLRGVRFGAVLFLDGGQVGERSRLTGVVAYDDGDGWRHLTDVGGSGGPVERLEVRIATPLVRGFGPPLDDSEKLRPHVIIGKCPKGTKRVIAMAGDRLVATCDVVDRNFFILIVVGDEQATVDST